jgi:predicted nucleic acid-binding protein
VYVDTSVLGGAFDDEFSDESKAFFEAAANGRFHIVISGIVRDEIDAAPAEVQEFFTDLASTVELVEVGQDALRLLQAYIAAGVVSPKWRDDALHVATATVSGCSMIVSWNFRHIVHYQKIPKYNAVNVLNGYPPIAIHSPLEVIPDED